MAQQKLYTEEQVKQIVEKSRETGLTAEYLMLTTSAIELPSDEEIIGRFMNWFLKHYSTATKDGFFDYVNSLEEEVTIREILDEYFKNK